MEKIDYTEIVFTLSPDVVDMAGDIANMAVKGGIYVEDYTNLEENVEQIAHIDLIDEDLLKKDRSKAKIHIYLDETENPTETISYISEMYKANGISFTVDTSMCLYEDWAENWKKYFKPVNIGKRLVIRGLSLFSNREWPLVQEPTRPQDFVLSFSQNMLTAIRKFLMWVAAAAFWRWPVCCSEQKKLLEWILTSFRSKPLWKTPN